jgi:hypothetical protein
VAGDGGRHSDRFFFSPATLFSRTARPIAMRADNRIRAPWSTFLNFLKFDNLKFQKVSKKILDVYDDVFYSPAKFQTKIVCISIYIKNKL